MLGTAVLLLRGLLRVDSWSGEGRSKPITLIYFDGRGRAEPIRFVLGLAGVAFEEAFVRTRAEFNAVIADGHMPMRQLPVLLDGDLVLSQSMAIARHVARKFDLYGSGSLADAARVDMLADTALDFYVAGVLPFPFSGDVAKVRASQDKYLPLFESVLAPQVAAGNRCLVGAAPTYADAVLLTVVLGILEHDAAALKGRPALRAWLAAMRSHPNVAAFLTSDRRHPPGDKRYVAEVNASLGRS